MRRGRVCALLLFSVVWLGACSGSIGEPEPEEEIPGEPGAAPAGGPASGPGASPAPGGGGGGQPQGPGGGGGNPSAPPQPGVAPLRRLTVHEYSNTVRDLLGTAAAGKSLSIDSDRAGFTIGGPLSTATDASRVIDTADQVAAAASAKIAALLPCPNVTAATEGACAREFIEKFGRRAFRRPLDGGEVDDLFAVYNHHREPAIGYGFPEAIRAVVSAMLSSPFFLYRAELGPGKPIVDGKFVRFNSHEVASRLSYALWATMPDDTLFTEADGNRLSTPDQIEAQARRMMKDERFRETIHDFHLQWLEIEGLPTEPAKDAKFKDHTPELVQAMLAETKTFVANLFVGPQATGSLEQLFTSTKTTVDSSLAKLYGVTAAAPGPREITLDPKQRAGILTQASFLSMHADTGESHPVRRGAMLMRRVFCIDVPPPPNMEVGEAKAPAPGLTTRERYAEHAKQECASCHRLTDPMGFSLEHYDATGAYRTQDQGQMVDASGKLDLPSGAVSFADGVELAKKLPQIPEVQECLTAQWLRYSLRRNEFEGDKASLTAARAALTRSSGDMREMLAAFFKSQAFTHRAPATGEVLR